MKEPWDYDYSEYHAGIGGGLGTQKIKMRSYHPGGPSVILQTGCKEAGSRAIREVLLLNVSFCRRTNGCLLK